MSGTASDLELLVGRISTLAHKIAKHTSLDRLPGDVRVELQKYIDMEICLECGTLIEEKDMKFERTIPDNKKQLVSWVCPKCGAITEI